MGTCWRSWRLSLGERPEMPIRLSLWSLSWGSLEGLLGRLGALVGASRAVLERRKEGKARKQKNIEKTNENQRFWPLGALLGGLLGRVGGLMEPSWGVLGATWQFLRLSMRVLERSRGVLGGLQPILAVSGALRDPSDPPRTAGERPWGTAAAPRPPPAYSDIYIYIYIYIYLYHIFNVYIIFVNFLLHIHI